MVITLHNSIELHQNRINIADDTGVSCVYIFVW